MGFLCDKALSKMASGSGQSNGATTTTSESTKPVVRSTPKDALVMSAILREMGISDYEPRVVNQMLEFTYRKFYIVILCLSNNGTKFFWWFIDKILIILLKTNQNTVNSWDYKRLKTAYMPLLINYIVLHIN